MLDLSDPHWRLDYLAKHVFEEIVSGMTADQIAGLSRDAVLAEVDQEIAHRVAEWVDELGQQVGRVLTRLRELGERTASTGA